MNKAELVTSMAEKSGLTKKDAEMALNAFMKSVEEALVAGDKVQLVGFGTFDVRERKERKGRNPRNPEQVIDIPASKAPVFKAGKALKELVKQVIKVKSSLAAFFFILERNHFFSNMSLVDSQPSLVEILLWSNRVWVL